ncbi:bifunctional nuclease family protein [Wenzhouxiangella sp. AB-CW3]|uniref:bifunctional nuclease domain-containing protein n=1 Tax=Wenzhouxiangella sp. AB-CW3 TaxID=2771012 RepID=UPI00168BDE47|nr:bifunctional nuclease domain-containing protein [Wenzhouxiangella sp. AB-CW3]QOC21461.1 bifunctional nuclease family protein [Wenzhouxiangella sp. AB-CW3]
MQYISRYLSILIIGIGLCGHTGARELAVEFDTLVPAELASVAVEPMTGTPVVLLREPDDGRIVPIFIGPNEARAILVAQRGIESERPMTHDLATDLIQSLDAKLERVIVDELRNGTYYGALELSRADSDEIVRVDTRPSDGLALAARTGASILVAPAILEAGEDIPFRGLDDDDEVVTAIGITVMPASDDIRQALNLPDEPGVLVTNSRSHAEQAGLRAGALILAVDDETIETPMDFLESISAATAEGKAMIRFWHEGETHEVELSTEVPEIDPERRQRL